jgi:hypothetical protein
MTMLRMALALGLAVIAAPALAAPDARTCPRPASPDGGERQRKTPLPVPPALRPTMGSSLYHYAVASHAGTRICVDTSWMETAETIAATPDLRFISFGWLGYETYGYILVDRAGRGKVHEIGAKPVFSPSRRLFAAIDQTESEFGSLSGLKVWRVDPAAVVEIGAVADIPRMYDWRIDGWAGEACLNLSAIRFEEQQRDVPVDRMRRIRFVAKSGRGGWRVLPASGANRCP